MLIGVLIHPQISHTGQDNPTPVVMREINLVIINHEGVNLQAVKNQLT